MAMQIFPVKGAESTEGRIKSGFFDLTFQTNDYATGGYLLTPDDFGLLGLVSVEIVGQSAAADPDANGIFTPSSTPLTTAFVVMWNFVTSRLQVFQGDNDNAGDAPAIEVPNATNLTGRAWRVKATGWQ